MCVRACARACVRACVRARVCVCVCMCVCSLLQIFSVCPRSCEFSVFVVTVVLRAFFLSSRSCEFSVFVFFHRYFLVASKKKAQEAESRGEKGEAPDFTGTVVDSSSAFQAEFSAGIRNKNDY